MNRKFKKIMKIIKNKALLDLAQDYFYNIFKIIQVSCITNHKAIQNWRKNQEISINKSVTRTQVKSNSIWPQIV